MRLFPFLFVLLSVSFLSYAQTTHKPYKFIAGFKNENDAYLFIGQDQYYTNGIFLFLKKSVASKSEHIVNKIWEINAGQKIYNPYSGYAPVKQLIDRPFTGYLYGSFGINWFYRNESSLKLEFQLGTIGTNSLGEKAQMFYHKLFGFYKPKGWEYQLKNEFGINTKINYLQKLHRSENLKNDFSIPLEARIGNTFSGFSAGILYRTGKIAELNRSIATQSNIGNSAASSPTEFYFYLKPAIDFIAYDATISGGMFNQTSEEEITFGSKPLVFSQELGIAYAPARWNFGFALIFKSKEVKSWATGHQYGVLDIAYKFN